MKIIIPDNAVKITSENIQQSWYLFFDKICKKVIGYYNSTLSAILLKDTDTEGNTGGGETSISNFLLRKETLGNIEVIDIFIGGTFASNGNNKTLRLKLNATTIYTNTVATSGGSWQINAKIINLGSTQKIFINRAGVSTYTTSAIDTSANDIDIILTLQGVATNDIVKEYFEIKYNA